MAHSLLPVQLGPLWLLIGASSVEEVLGAVPWVRIPRAHELLPGVLAWRGRALPVLDLARVLNLPAIEDSDRSRTLVVRAGSSTLAVPVDAAREVATFADHELHAAQVLTSRFVRFEAELRDVLMAVVDIDALTQSMLVSDGAAEG
jgi:chemotaxis signal transduction protein